MAYRAEYMWIDGTEPTPEIRSKTKILDDGAELGIWGFDGSSTNQATGDNSDVVLQPVFTCPDPIRGGDNVLVMCETLLTADLSPHPTNTRAIARAAMDKYSDQEPLFGLEQEYTMMQPGSGWPYGFPQHGYPGPQGPYYCGVGAVKIAGREHRRGAHHHVHRGRPHDLGHQRRGHARPVGVPDRPRRHGHRR